MAAPAGAVYLSYSADARATGRWAVTASVLAWHILGQIVSAVAIRVPVCVPAPLHVERVDHNAKHGRVEVAQLVLEVYSTFPSCPLEPANDNNPAYLRNERDGVGH